MCGICGFKSKTDNDNPKFLSEMLSAISHRGPDHEGRNLYEVADGSTVALGHRRLSIVELSELGHQPMFDDQGRVGIVFNGEIYNYLTLRKELKACGYKFKSNSDTEVIIYAYIEWGNDFVKRLNGMFAIALYDYRTNKLLLIRDRIGIKPLYYSFRDGSFVFASEINSIVRHPSVDKIISDEGLELYFTHGYITAPYTIYEDVYKLEPGTYIQYDGNSILKTEYWHSEYKTDKISLEDSLNTLDGLLMDSVTMRLQSDVNVGCFLSGGKDSSLIASYLSRGAGKDVETFTIGFDDPSHDEVLHAKKVSEHLGLKNNSLYFNEKELLKEFNSFSDYFGEPFADESSIPTMILSQFAKKSGTVMLSGDGGDELFCGYKTYQHINKLTGMYNKLGLFNKLLTSESISPIYEKLDWRLLAFRGVRSESDIINFGSNIDLYFLNNVLGNNIGLTEKYRTKNNSFSPECKRMSVDVDTYLVDNCLTKVDRSSMKYGLEVRVPLLDHRVIEFAQKNPFTKSFMDGKSKPLLSELLKRYLPNELVDRPKKGFSVPLNRWLNDYLSEEKEYYFSEEVISRQGIFDYKNLRAFMNRYQNNGAYFDKLIWRLFIFQIWYFKNYRRGSND